MRHRFFDFGPCRPDTQLRDSVGHDVIGNATTLLKGRDLICSFDDAFKLVDLIVGDFASNLTFKIFCALLIVCVLINAFRCVLILQISLTVQILCLHEADAFRLTRGK